MNKKLTAKTQYLNPILNESVKAFSNGFVIEPDTPELVLKKGTIYTVFAISGDTIFDIGLINKVVLDVLHDSYYQSDNISPIQSLEKAIVEVRDRVTQLSQESIAQESQPALFSIITGVLWGNVMYVVQYGSAESYLIRKGEIRPINTVAEGTFSAASGVVKDEDVILLCSKDFSRKYPPDKLLTTSVNEQQLEPQESCILLKFLVDTTFSPNETVDFGLAETVAVNNIKSKKMGDEILKAIKKVKLPKLHFAKKQGSRIKPVDSIEIKLRPQRSGIKFKPVMLLPIIALALGISIFYSVKNKHVGGTKNTVGKTTITTNQENNAVPVQENVEKPVEQDNEIFYDIKLADAQAEPQDLASFTDYVVATDAKNGKIYQSDTITPKFEVNTDTFSGISSPINIKGKLGFVTSTEGYKVYDLSTNKVVESYLLPNPGIVSAYLDFVYELADSKITRYSKDGTNLTGTLWTQNEELGQAKSIAVAYSVYVLSADGKLLKYTSGQKNDFSLKGDATTLAKPVKAVTDIDFDNIYIADAGNKRVVVYDKEGNFIKEYKAKQEDRWADMRSITVSPDEKTLFVLSGSKVYKVAL